MNTVFDYCQAWVILKRSISYVHVGLFRRWKYMVWFGKNIKNIQYKAYTIKQPVNICNGNKTRCV